MKKSLFALALAVCFAFGASECEKYEKECNDGNMKSCHTAAFICEVGAASLKLLEKACDGGNIESCLFAATQHKDPAKSYELFKKACDGGEDLACPFVIYKIIDEDPKEGIKFAERKCSEGSGNSCGFLAAFYHAGKFVEKNIKEAINYYDKACNAKIGHAFSCESLMKMYDEGKEGKMDKLKSGVYMKKGCDLGDCVACYNFANFNYYTIKDKSKAAQYYKKACDISKDHIIFRESEIYEKSCDMYELLK